MMVAMWALARAYTPPEAPARKVSGGTTEERREPDTTPRE